MTRLACAPWALIAFSALQAQVPTPVGQVQDLPYQVRYIANLNFGDSSINITNSGAQGAGLASGTTAATTGALCANVYVFSPDEQLIACCSCPVTPNGLVALSAQRDLIGNTLTPSVPTSIVVKLLGSYPAAATLPGGSPSCSNSAANPLDINGAPITPATAPLGLLAWATTVHRGPSGGTVNTGLNELTETAFSPGVLNNGGPTPVGTGGVVFQPNIGELARLRQLCTFNQANGSGFGVCRSCQLGGLGAGRL